MWRILCYESYVANLICESHVVNLMVSILAEHPHAAHPQKIAAKAPYFLAKISDFHQIPAKAQQFPS